MNDRRERHARQEAWTNGAGACAEPTGHEFNPLPKSGGMVSSLLFPAHGSSHDEKGGMSLKKSTAVQSLLSGLAQCGRATLSEMSDRLIDNLYVLP